MPLFFVHIPKTAGTSFRLGAEQLFSKSRIVYDYGKLSQETSPLAQQTLYAERPDFWALRMGCERQQAAMVGGHVSVGRFVSLFGVGQGLTFVREPLQRMASEYAHFVRNYEYKGSFHDFYSRSVMHNRQSKMLHGVELEAMGFVGLTERYAQSLEVLNDHFNIRIPQREDNRGKKSLNAEHEISANDKAELRRMNRRDIAFYKRATALFEQRYQLFKENVPWVHARLVECSVQRIAGWAWWADASGDAPVEVEVWVNNQHIDSVYAVDLRPRLCRLLPPRGGYVGFQLSVKLKPGDKVQCRVARTGQRFPLQPSQVPESEAK